MAGDCLFCSVVSGDLPVERLHDDDLCLAVRHPRPKAPWHLVIASKEHLSSARDITGGHGGLLARMVGVANQLADGERIAESGYLLAVNCGEDAGQTVFHLHLHVLGGHKLGAEG